MTYSSHKNYRKALSESLDNDFLLEALDNFTANYPESREKAFEGLNIEKLVNDVVALKERAIKNHEQLFNKFKQQAESKGIIVHYAKDAKEANQVISGIARKTGVKKIIKSKSMTSEETYLNKQLEEDGFEVTETDLGEWIIQLRKEGPSHMVIPAVHLSKEQVSDLFSGVTGDIQPAVIEKLVKVARKELRSKFIEADMGITGVNFAIAESGTIGIVTNEGNARLVTTLPKIQVALTGIEKVVENLEDALKILKVLPGNATGQRITSYVTWITGLNQCKKEPEGKKEYHIVFLDNGRQEIIKDKKFTETLNCIRCGACANVCPVYGMIGGHKMGHTYIGPIGLILTWFFHGKENARYLVQNCIDCKACEKVCSSGIKLPDLIKEIQNRVGELYGKPVSTKLAGRLIQNRKLFHTFLRAAKYGQKPFTRGQSFQRHLPNILFLKDQKFRSIPAIAKRPLRDMWKDLKTSINEPKYRIALFAGCLNDFVYPEQVEAAVGIFKKYKVSTDFPLKQNCCGLPLSMNNDKKNTKKIINQNVNAFYPGNYDFVVTLCASCASFIKKSYLEFFEEDHEDYKKIKQFSDKMIDFSSFIMDVLKVSDKDFQGISTRITYHSPCHLCRGLEVPETPRNLLRTAGLKYIPARGEEVCCGLGGTYSLKFPEISEGMLKKKLDNIEATGAEMVVTDCPGCVMQLKGGADKRKSKIMVKHISELIAGRLLK